MIGELTFPEYIENVLNKDNSKAMMYLLSKDLQTEEIKDQFLLYCKGHLFTPDMDSIEPYLKEIRGQ